VLLAQRTTHFHVFHALQPVSYTTIDGVCVCVVARETCVLRMDSERERPHTYLYIYTTTILPRKLSAVDVLALATMKNAAKCDT